MDLAALLEENKVVIKDRLAADFSASVAKTLGWTLEHEVQKFAENYINENVLPEVQKQLEADKEAITVAIVAGVKTGLDLLSLKLVEQMTKNINSSWKISTIAKALLGG